MKNEQCWYKEVCPQDCSASCIRYAEMKYLLDNSGIPQKRQIPQELTAGVDYDVFVRLADAKAEIKHSVTSGKNLYICSRYTGNGKTSWAIKLLLKYFDSVWAGNGFRVRGLFIHVPTLLSELKDFDNPDLKQRRDMLVSVDVVVWDDIASTKLSAYDESQLLNIIDRRMLECRSNIFTGNLVSLEKLENVLGARLASRVWNGSEIFELVGKDRR